MEFEERAADPLAGGMMRGYQCGMLWGATLAAGAQVYHTYGKGPQAQIKAIVASQRIAESFRTQNKNINCHEITGIDLSAPTARAIVRFLIKSGATGSCLGMAARCARTAFDDINAAPAQTQIEAAATPVSCSAMLAQKTGASDMHTVMAAGLAGGIGLSGGACGALGAALWFKSMDRVRQGAEVDLNASGDVIERFARYTNGEFECSKIVGRKFESLADHAGYLRAGGCAKIIDTFAVQRD